MQHLGNTWEITLPSGKKFTFRETNGDDDAILSTMGSAESGENVDIFLANIIVSPQVLARDIADWPINDKYYALFKNRVLNQGYDFIFKHIDPADTQKRPHEYTEDLRPLDGDFSDKAYKPTANQVKHYPFGEATHVEFVTSSKRKFRFKIMTGIMESAALDQPREKNNKNTILLSREIEIWKNNQWERLYLFKDISSKEMVELRSQVIKNDPPFDPTVTFTNPFTKNLFQVPLMSMPTFYFPEETI